jgi:hypothetical protein
MSSGPRFQVELAQTDDSTRDTYVVFDETTGNMAVDYSQYYARMADAAEATQAAVEEIRDIINGTQEVTGGGVPIKDIYAALSYSALIKVFNEEGVDIDSLIEQTQAKLDGLSDAGNN